MTKIELIIVAGLLYGVGTVCWKEGRGKTYDEFVMVHQSRNDLLIQLELDSIRLEKCTK